MPWGVKTSLRREALPKPEILKYPLETNVIDHAVLNASGITADASGPYAGRRYLLAGTVLSKRTDNQFERYVSGASQAVAGVLFDTVEFVDDSDASDEPAAYLRRNVSFDVTKIVDFETYESDIRAALTTCEFV